MRISDWSSDVCSSDLIPGVAKNVGVLIDDRPLQREVGVDSLAAVVGAGFDLGGSWRGEATLSYSREEQFRDSDVQRNANIYDYLPTPAGGQMQAPTSIQCSQGLPPNASPAPQAYCAGLGKHRKGSPEGKSVL